MVFKWSNKTGLNGVLNSVLEFRFFCFFVERSSMALTCYGINSRITS